MDVGVVQPSDGQMRTRTGYIASSAALGADGQPECQITTTKKDDRASSPRSLVEGDLPLLKQITPGIGEIEETPVTVNGHSALRLTFTAAADGVAIKSVLYAIMTSDGRGYTVRCDVNLDAFDRYAGVIDAAVNSFKPF